MRYEDYRLQIETDSEYLTAQNALKLYFALGDAVIKARTNRGWSQTELARRVGTKQANISRIEAAIANPTLSLLQKLTEVLELDIIFMPLVSTTYSVVAYKPENSWLEGVASSTLIHIAQASNELSQTVGNFQ